MFRFALPFIPSESIAMSNNLNPPELLTFCILQVRGCVYCSLLPGNGPRTLLFRLLDDDFIEPFIFKPGLKYIDVAFRYAVPPFILFTGRWKTKTSVALTTTGT